MTPNRFKKLILLSTLAALILSACELWNATPTPTEVSLEAVYTAAAATVFAGQTGTAGAKGARTVTPTPSISPSPSATVKPSATSAAGVLVIQPVIVAASTRTGTPWTLTPSLGAVGCNNSAQVSEVAVPNMKAGDSFTKTWKIKNTGSCAWNSNYKISFWGGELMNSDTRKIRQSVAVGASIDITLPDLVAPIPPGTYTGYWRMADDSGIPFGPIFTVVVTISGATYTPTSSVSATPNATTTAAAAGTAAANANIVATAVAATQTAAAAQTAAAGPAATQAAIDAANAAATQAAIDATNTAAAQAAAATQAAIDATNAAATQAAADETQAVADITATAAASITPQ